MTNRTQLSLARRELAHTPVQDAAQPTTNDFVLVAGQTLKGGERDRIAFSIENTDGANVIVARVVGRMRSYDPATETEEYGEWVVCKDAAGADISSNVAASSTIALAVVDPIFDEYGVEVESSVDDSHGAAVVHGTARSTT
jgi:hypothetical protein